MAEKGIDWTKVIVGETEIWDGNLFKKVVVAHEGDWAWLRSSDGEYETYHKDALRHCTIYDPWVEVSQECEVIIDSVGSLPVFTILYKGQIVSPNDPRWKVGPGLRVWMRKEG